MNLDSCPFLKAKSWNFKIHRKERRMEMTEIRKVVDCRTGEGYVHSIPSINDVTRILINGLVYFWNGDDEVCWGYGKLLDDGTLNLF
jgi:hypothetical protein